MMRFVKMEGWSMTILFAFAAASGQGQQVRFSQFYDIDNTAGAFTKLVLLDDDRFLVIGGGTSGGFETGYHFIVDEFGQTVNANGFSLLDQSIKPRGLIRKLETGTNYVAGYYCDFSIPSPSYCDFYFGKLDETGDTLFTKIYERKDTCEALLDMVQTRHNKIMLIGWTCNDTTQNNTELMFITVDTMGNELNRVVWGGGSTDFVGSGVVVDSFGDVVMTGYTKSFPSFNSGRTWVVRTDSVGNVKWYKTYSGVSGVSSSAARIAMLPDGNLLVAGGNSGFGSGTFGGDGSLMKIDTAGNEIWAREYEVLGGQGLWGVVGLEDGAIVSCGVTDGPSGSQAGWLIKTDASGDTLWTRTYDSSDLIDYLRNMIVLPDGDIVMVGHGRPEGQTNQDGWILRVDSMGCVVENCFLTSVNDELEIRDEKLRVWPNPAESVLNIVSEQAMEEVRLYDMQGRVVSSFILSQQQSLELDVSGLNTGLFILEVVDTEGIRSVRKVMVERP